METFSLQIYQSIVIEDLLYALLSFKVYNYENIEISKAECLGYFKMGSTVVMLWEKDFVELENLLNKNVRFGQKISNIR